MPTLQWLNREGALGGADAAPYRLLVEDAELSAGSADAGNMLIQGDNLEALKSLLPMFAGRVKCVFIDPPYNTGSAFEHYDDNLEHSQWLSLMYPRLELLRDLLAEDGSIWITIDDAEAHYLKIICDEVFGRKNFVANVVWQKKYAVSNDHKSIAPMHDYVLVYRKSSLWQRNLVPRTSGKDSQYKFEDERGVFRISDYTCNKTSDERPNLYYPIKQPFSGESVLPNKTRVWAYSEDEHKRHIEQDLIYWGKDGKSKKPGFKRYINTLRHDGIVPQTLWFHTEAGHTDAARKEIRRVLATEALADDFLTPKPEKLIYQVLTIATNPGDLVLDSFLGSGTTAAVAHKMGRRYIGIELGDHAVTHCVPRLKKVIEGEQGGISESVGWKGGGGFRFYRLGPAVFDAEGALHPDIRFPTLAAHIWFSETKTPWGDACATLGQSPLLGVHDGVAYYLLFNGILGDRRPQGGNVLNDPVFRMLPPHDGPKVIYGEWSQWRADRLLREQIEFRQIPYDVRVR